MTQSPKQNCKWEENLLEHDLLLLSSPIFLKKYKETHLFTQFSRLKQKIVILFSLSFQNLSKNMFSFEIMHHVLFTKTKNQKIKDSCITFQTKKQKPLFPIS